MIIRKENGHIGVKTLDMGIFFDDLFSHCKTEEEIDFVLCNIQDISDISADDQRERIWSNDAEIKI